MGKRRGFSQDMSSFMCIILMMIGMLVIVLIVNVVTIVSNPENIRITSIIQSSGNYAEGSTDGSGQPPFPFGNKTKEPLYVDVHRDHLVLYPGAEVVPLRDLEREGNGFEKMLGMVSTNRELEYIVLLARPGSALVVHRLKKVVRDSGVDLGFELYEGDRTVEYDRAAKASGRTSAQP